MPATDKMCTVGRRTYLLSLDRLCIKSYDFLKEKDLNYDDNRCRNSDHIANRAFGRLFSSIALITAVKKLIRTVTHY